MNQDGLGEPAMRRASFTSLEGATIHDWEIIDGLENRRREQAKLVDNLFALLKLQDVSDSFGWPINSYRHGVQTASRAWRGGEDERTIVAALFHDVTETIDHQDHGASAALLLEPYIGEANAWMLRHHVLFQDYHCKSHPTRFTTGREAFRGHPYFERTARFCEFYDQNSFDANYDDLPLAAFDPVVRRVFLEPRS